MKTSNNVNKSLFIVLPFISILVDIALGVFIIQPRITSVLEKQAQVQSAQTEQQKLDTKIKSLDVLSANKIDLTAQLTAVDLALPTQKDVPNLIIQIQKIAQESDVEVQGIQLTPGKLLNDTAPVSKVGPEITATLSVRGNYEAIKTFFGKLYRAKRLINMESITLNSGGSESDGTLAVTIAINTYYQPLSNSRPSSESEDLPMLTKSDQDIYSKLQSYTSYQLDGSAPIQQEEPQQASQSATPALREAPETSPSATP